MVEPLINSAAALFIHDKTSDATPESSNIPNFRSIEGLQMKLESQYKEIKEKTAKIASLEEDVVAKKTQVSYLQSTKECQTIKINQLNRKIEDFQDKVTRLEAEICGKLKDITKLTSDAEKKSQVVDRKAAEIISLETKVKAKNDQIAKIENKLISDKNLYDQDKLKEVESLCVEIDSWKVLGLARDSEVDTLTIEAHKREKKVQHQDKRIEDLQNKIRSKDALIHILNLENGTAALENVDPK